MANMSLEELRNKNHGAVIDTTAGKITTPAESSTKTLAESDPAFMPSNQSVKGTKRTPVIDDPPMPKINVVNASFDASSAKKFDINTLEKRPPEENPYENEIMSDLDKAVEREKKSISERIQAITDKQYEEFIEGMTREDVKRIVESGNGDSDNDDDEEDIPSPPVLNNNNANKKIVIKEDNEEEEDMDKVQEDDGSMTADTVEEKEEAPVRFVKKTIEIAEDDDDDSDLDGNDYRNSEFVSAVSETNESSDDTANTALNLNDVDKDISSEVSLEDDEPDTDTIFEQFKDSVKSKITPIKNKINLKNFKINSKPISASKIHLNISDISVADYVLPNSDRIISMSALNGPEMLRMNPERSSRNRINALRDMYSILYNHIESYKPKNFDEWLKTTKFADIDHIYFCAYKATFGGSNFMNYECRNPKCRHAFIQDVSFDDLIKYDNDEIKEKMQKLLRSGKDSPVDNEVILHQISDQFVLGLRNPSIYNVVIETASLSEDFLNKYEELIDVLAYIDSVYIINNEDSSLDPIYIKEDENDIAKNAARRIKIMSGILRTLSSDSYFDLRSAITTTFPNINSIHYRIPETKCPKCGSVIPEIDVEAQQLLFMRHQLGAFATL